MQNWEKKMENGKWKMENKVTKYAGLEASAE
jgi:hypothetical protein